MNEQEIFAEFEAAEAILKGHFILSSGLHSDMYLQCARVLMNPARAEKLCHALAEKLRAAGIEKAPAEKNVQGHHTSRTTHHAPRSIDLVVAPAMGGVVVGYEMGRQLGVETIFCEREEGKFTLRRGFIITPGARILLVEDVVTTGKSSLETVECIAAHGGVVVAEASLIDRSGGASRQLPFPLISLLTLDVRTYSASDLPPHLKEIPAMKPGSRFLKK
jgi:orotate phosphoribosyltransferase